MSKNLAKVGRKNLFLTGRNLRKTKGEDRGSTSFLCSFCDSLLDQVLVSIHVSEKEVWARIFFLSWEMKCHWSGKNSSKISKYIYRLVQKVFGPLYVDIYSYTCSWRELVSDRPRPLLQVMKLDRFTVCVCAVRAYWSISNKHFH